MDIWTHLDPCHSTTTIRLQMSRSTIEFSVALQENLERNFLSHIFPPEGFVVAICFIMLISQCGTVLSRRGTVAIGKVNTTIELSREGSEEGEATMPACAVRV